MTGKNMVDERLIKYQQMLRRRRLLYLCFLPAGLVLMLLLRAEGSPGISALSWPMLVLYIVLGIILDGILLVEDYGRCFTLMQI